jgi:hypothetical protein
MTIPRKLDTHVDWHAEDVADPASWTIALTTEDHKELDHALASAKADSEDLLEIDRLAFPLDTLAEKIGAIGRELIDGRGFVRISALDVERYCDDDLTMLYWGIGIHLGDPWPQNRRGHVEQRLAV